MLWISFTSDILFPKHCLSTQGWLAYLHKMLCTSFIYYDVCIKLFPVFEELGNHKAPTLSPACCFSATTIKICITRLAKPPCHWIYIITAREIFRPVTTTRMNTFIKVRTHTTTTNYPKEYAVCVLYSHKHLIDRFVFGERSWT